MKMKKGLIFIVVLTLLMSMMTVFSNAAVEEKAIELVKGDVAPGFNGSTYLHMGWGNYAGMKFDILEGELFVGVQVQTVIAGHQFKMSLYKWNTSREDKELLEQKEFTSTDWSPNVVFEFDNVYPAGTYFVTCKIEAGVEPRLVPYTEVIEGRNIEAHLYDKTFAEYNEEKAAAGESSNLGAGYRMWINVLQGAGQNALNFVNKYYEAKAEDVTIYDQAKYDAVMNAVGDDLKAFIMSTSEDDLGTQLGNLNAALTEPEPETEEPGTENPPTGESAIVMVAILAAMACAVVVKRKVYSF
jgi:hypothetical protein